VLVKLKYYTVKEGETLRISSTIISVRSCSAITSEEGRESQSIETMESQQFKAKLKMTGLIK
jgi:hypothetical protein